MDIRNLNRQQSQLIGLKLRATGNIKQERKRRMPSKKNLAVNQVKSPKESVKSLKDNKNGLPAPSNFSKGIPRKNIGPISDSKAKVNVPMRFKSPQAVQRDIMEQQSSGKKFMNIKNYLGPQNNVKMFISEDQFTSLRQENCEARDSDVRGKDPHTNPSITIKSKASKVSSKTGDKEPSKPLETEESKRDPPKL